MRASPLSIEGGEEEELGIVLVALLSCNGTDNFLFTVVQALELLVLCRRHL